MGDGCDMAMRSALVSPSERWNGPQFSARPQAMPLRRKSSGNSCTNARRARRRLRLISLGARRRLWAPPGYQRKQEKRGRHQRHPDEEKRPGDELQVRYPPRQREAISGVSTGVSKKNIVTYRCRFGSPSRQFEEDPPGGGGRQRAEKQQQDGERGLFAQLRAKIRCCDGDGNQDER